MMTKFLMFLYLITITMFTGCRANPNIDCDDGDTSSYAGGTSTQKAGFYVGMIGWSNREDTQDKTVNQYCVAYVHDYSKLKMGEQDSSFKDRTAFGVAPEFTIASAKECLAQMMQHEDSAALYLATDFSNLQKLLTTSDPALLEILNVKTLKIPLKGRLQVNIQNSHIGKPFTDAAAASAASAGTSFHYSEVSEVGVKFYGRDKTLTRIFVEQVGFRGLTQNHQNEFEGAFISEEAKQDTLDFDSSINNEWSLWDQKLSSMIYLGADEGIATLWNQMSVKAKANSSATHLYGKFIGTNTLRMVDKVADAFEMKASSTASVQSTQEEDQERRKGDTSNTFAAGPTAPAASAGDWSVASNANLLPGSFVMVNYRVVAAMRASSVKVALSDISTKTIQTDEVLKRLSSAKELAFEVDALKGTSGSGVAAASTQQPKGNTWLGFLSRLADGIIGLEMQTRKNKTHTTQTREKEQTGSEKENLDRIAELEGRVERMAETVEEQRKTIDSQSQEITSLKGGGGGRKGGGGGSGDATAASCPAQQ